MNLNHIPRVGQPVRERDDAPYRKDGAPARTGVVIGHDAWKGAVLEISPGEGAESYKAPAKHFEEVDPWAEEATDQPTLEDEDTPIVLEATLLSSQDKGIGDAVLRRLRVLSAPRYVRTWIFDGRDEIDGSEAAEMLIALLAHGHSFELQQTTVERVGIMAYLGSLPICSARASSVGAAGLIEPID